MHRTGTSGNALYAFVLGWAAVTEPTVAAQMPLKYLAPAWGDKRAEPLPNIPEDSRSPRPNEFAPRAAKPGTSSDHD